MKVRRGIVWVIATAYLHSDEPQVRVVDIRHEEVLGDLIHIAGVLVVSTIAIALAEVLRNLLGVQILLLEFASCVESCMVRRSPLIIERLVPFDEAVCGRYI